MEGRKLINLHLTFSDADGHGPAPGAQTGGAPGEYGSLEFVSNSHSVVNVGVRGVEVCYFILMFYCLGFSYDIL